MELRPHSCPQETRPEWPAASQASRPHWGPDEVREVQVPSSSHGGPSALAMLLQEEEHPSFIHACCMCRPQGEAQKLRFLASVRTASEAALASRDAHCQLYFCQEEVAQSIEVLLQEEPTGCLDSEVRQQAMLTVAAMSSARLLPDERKSSLLHACLCSVLHLPHYKDMNDQDAALYIKTMEALDHLLQVLVGSAGASGLLELQNILKLLLPFTKCQLAAVEERAIACIARLLAFSSTCSLPKVCSCFTGAGVLRHHCTDNQRFPTLGRLVAHLILCCTSADEGTSNEALEAVHQLFTFITNQRMWLWQQDAKRPQFQEHRRTMFYQQVCQRNNTSKTFEMFLKYLQRPERVDVFFTAIESMGALSPHSTELAAHMVDVLVAEAHFYSGQVQKIMQTIYKTLPNITAALALQSLDRALLVLASNHPREMVVSLLCCSPTCTSEAVTMWKAMLTEPPAVEKVLQELLRVLTNHSLRHTSASTRDRPRVLALAAARTIPEILQLPPVLKEVEAVFPRLFVALLLQVSFTTELTLPEVEIFWKGHQQDQLTPIRSTVHSMKVLLCGVGLEKQVEAIQERGGWDALQSATSHLQGVQEVARAMRELPAALRATIFHQLAELLSTEVSSWEMVAMVFLIEMQEGTDLSTELDRAVALFATSLQSQCVSVQHLVLRTIWELTKKWDTERKMLDLLPHIVEQLQEAESDVCALALPVLSTMLPHLEGRKRSLMALELASKLPTLFKDECSLVRQLSIRLFLNALGFVQGSEKRKMKKELYRSLVPLCLHLHDEDRSVAKAAQEAFLGATRLLRWRQLEHLAETGQFWQIGECMLVQRRNSRAQDYLSQSLPYLQSPQEPLRLEAVRFL
ncbi:MROH7 protein, partial [Penelope pileata]|nr:MROH7 protein [Penelope pileata]